MEALLVEQAALIAELRAEVAELRARLAGSSRNSSRPPSSDGFSKPRVDSSKRSLRERSPRQPGGQAGHEGVRLDPVEAPDERVEHLPQRCVECGADLAGADVLDGEECRQVFNLPALALRVTEHVALRRRCRCGVVTAGAFPLEVTAQTQYGSGVRALGVYLHVFQHLPYERACQLLADLLGAQVSSGTLAAWVEKAADGLCDFDTRLRELLIAAPVVHFDETGARIAGCLGWVHSTSTDTLTRYVAHTRRGAVAIDAAGVLPTFRGVAAHDGWAPYRSYDAAEHALCNVHHLRELVAAAEAGHTWPVAMSCLLLDTRELVQAAHAAGRRRLAAEALDELAASYETIIAMGHQEHPASTAKRSKAHNLLLRLERDRTEVLRFAHDFNVPFSNNRAEQDIRMVKLQQKISGCWRTSEGAERYLKIRGYISSARKNGLAPLDALGRLAAGRPWLPAPT
jgi:transposase